VGGDVKTKAKFSANQFPFQHNQILKCGSLKKDYKYDLYPLLESVCNQKHPLCCLFLVRKDTFGLYANNCFHMFYLKEAEHAYL